MRYGHFDDAAREYVITRPDTPLPWINYLGSEDYFGIISNTAGGYSFYRDARLRRLTRYRYNNAPLDLGGRYLYLRDDESGDVLEPELAADASATSRSTAAGTASATRSSRRATPASAPRRSTSCRSARRSRSGARGSPTSASTPARLSLFSAVEFCLWDAQDDATNFQRNYSIGEVEVEDGVIYHKTEYRERRDHFAFFACSAPLAGFDTQRDAFLGPYRGWDRPLAVEAGNVAQLDRARLAADRLAPRPPRAGAGRDARGHLRARLRREPGRRQVRPARLRRPSTSAACAR